MGAASRQASGIQDASIEPDQSRVRLLVEKSDTTRMTVNGPTVLDVVENHLDCVLDARRPPRLNSPELDDLGELLAEFYSQWKVNPPEPDVLRINSAGVKPDNVSQVLAELLYAHEAVIYDPLERALRSASAERQDDAQDALATLATLAPLIRRGIVLPAPKERLLDGKKAEIEAAAMELADRNPNWFWYEVVEGVLPPLKYSEEAMRFARAWSEHLACSAATNSCLTPIDDVGYRIHRRSLEVLAEQAGVYAGLQIGPAIFAAELPWLSPSDPRTLVEVHNDDSDFLEWRLALSSAIRGLRALPTDADFAKEAQDMFIEELGGIAGRLERARTPTVARLQEGLVYLTLDTLFLAIAAVVTSLPLDGDLVSAAAGQLAVFMTKSLLHTEPGRPGDGQTAVLASLINERKGK